MACKGFLRKRIGAVFLLAGIMGNCFVTSADGLAGEYITSQRWRDALSRHSALANPAYLTEENCLSFRGCEALVLDNTFNLTEAGITIPVGLYESYGITYAGEGTGMQLNGLQWHRDYLGGMDTIGNVSNRDNLFMLSYANNVWGPLSLGANLAFTYQTMFGSPRIGLGGDFGLSYRLVLNPQYGEHLLGISLQNILQPLVDLLPVSDQFTSQPYSNNVKLSWNAYFFDRQLDAGVDFDVKNLYGSLVKLKGESNPGVMEYGAAVRLGAWLLRMINAYVLLGTDYWAGTVGMNFPQINFGKDFSVLYQYMSVNQVESVPVQSVYFRMDFGRHREESYALAMAKQWNMAPNDLYNKALRLYNAKNYWDAFFVFSELYAQYPAFIKTDMVAYYRGACLEKLDMREMAANYYKETLRQYPSSPIAPNTDLGLMRICYRDGNISSVEGLYNRLTDSNTPDSIRYHACYLMAQAKMLAKDYEDAIRYFQKVPQYHPEYVFAQHSCAVAALMLGRRDEAIEHLVNCFVVKEQGLAEKECVNRSYLYLGYLFYDNLELPKAITALRNVPSNSYYYEDALLGMCWTALKAKQWASCIEYGQTLQKISIRPPLRCDAMLIIGYSYLMQKKYADANATLKEADALLSSISAPDQDSYKRFQTGTNSTRDQYNELAKTADKISLAPHNSDNAQTIDSLHKAQIDSKAQLDNYTVFFDEFKRQSLFARSAESIKNDISFTYAIAQKFNRDAKAIEEQEKMQGKQNKIDEKIEQMKKELEKLNKGTR